MKLKSHLLLETVAATAIFCTVAIAQTGKPVELKAAALRSTFEPVFWGDVDPSGLQLGAFQTKTYNSLVFCTIRNRGIDEVGYNLFSFIYAGVIPLEARPEGTQEWKAIKNTSMYLFAGIGPSYYKVVVLKPSQELRDYSRESLWKHEDSGRPLILSFKTSLKIIKYMETQKSYQSLPKHTFLVRLADFDWPTDWKGAIEIRVRHNFSSGTLTSGSLKLPAADFQEILAKRKEQLIKNPTSSIRILE